MKKTPVKGECRWCAQPILLKDGSVNLRRTWHPKCVTEYFNATDPARQRQMVFDRDRGVCCECGINTEVERKKYMVGVLTLPGRGRGRPSRILWDHRRAFADGWPDWERSWWDMDHTRPLAEAKGDVSFWALDNLTTRCYRCHAKKTVEDNRRIRAAKKK